MNQPDSSGIIFPQEEYDDYVDFIDHTAEKVHLTKCSADFQIEQPEGVLRVCSEAKDKDYTKEGLRIIAELRDRTTLIIEQTCNNHKKPPHMMGDMLEGCFDELLEAETEVKHMIGDIIQFPKK